MNKLMMYSDCRGRLQHKDFVQNAEKIVQVAFFFTETSNVENKNTVYLIFTNCMWSSSHFYSRCITVNLRLKNVWSSDYPTDTPSSPF